MDDCRPSSPSTVTSSSEIYVDMIDLELELCESQRGARIFCPKWNYESFPGMRQLGHRNDAL